MHSKSTTKTTHVRQPCAKGADAVYNRIERCYDAFVDGRYIGSRTLSEDALIEARRVYGAMIEAAAVETVDRNTYQAHTVEQVVYLTIDSVIDIMERRPDTKPRRIAWEWLAEVSYVRFINDALIVPSATWSNTSYCATPTTCSCPAKGYCWHQEAAQIVTDAIAEDAAIDALALRDVLPFDLEADIITYPVDESPWCAHVYSDIAELYS